MTPLPTTLSACSVTSCCYHTDLLSLLLLVAMDTVVTFVIPLAAIVIS
jgi:hypothetical protein